MISDSISIGIFQFDLIWENISANRLKVESLLKELNIIPDILILPEMFTSGFTMHPDKLSREELLEHLKWQQKLSVKLRLSILGSVICPDGKYFKNRMIATYSHGGHDFYDKQHLFFNEKESGYFMPGKVRKTFNINGIKLMPQICYDLRFPVWSRNNLDYHILIYSANWPAQRQKVWETLIPARAIENQCYTVGVNRVGKDGNNIEYLGGSTIHSPKGEELLKMGSNEEYTQMNISIKELIQFRSKFKVLKDKDEFKLDV